MKAILLMSALMISANSFSQTVPCQKVTAIDYNSATYVVTLSSGETLTTIGTNEEFKECYELAKLALVNGLKYCVPMPDSCRVEK